MSTEPAFLAHYAVGLIAILCWWGAFLNRKGDVRHRTFGQVFLVVLSLTLVTVGFVLFGSGKGFSPAELIQFTYLVLCVLVVGGTAFMAIRLKRDVNRFRGFWFRAFGIAAFVMGLVVLAAGIATGNPLPILFSVIGLLYGGAMIRFALIKGDLHPRWWLGWHLNGMCFLFNAVHGTFLAQTYVAISSSTDDLPANLVAQTATMLISLLLRIHFGRRFDAPLGFRAPNAGSGALHSATGM